MDFSLLSVLVLLVVSPFPRTLNSICAPLNPKSHFSVSVAPKGTCPVLLADDYQCVCRMKTSFFITAFYSLYPHIV